MAWRLKEMSNAFQLFLAGLFEGLTRTTTASLLVMLLTIALIILGFTPQLFTLIPHEYFINQPRGLDVLASQKVLKLRLEPEDKLAVTLIGASSLHEALLGENELDQGLSDRLHRPVAVTKLTARGLKILDVVRFIDQIPVSYKGIVLICVNTELYKHPQKSLSRFPITSKLYNNEIRKAGISPPPQTGIFLLDNYRFFSSRSKILAKALVYGPVRPITYVQEGIDLSERKPKKRKKIIKKAKTLIHSFQKRSMSNFQLLSVIISKLQASGIKVVYLHPPRNIEFLQPIYESINRGDYLQTLDDDIAKFAETSGITYWNLNDKDFFSYDDFRDYSHISNTEARTRYSEMLLDNLGHLIQVEFKGKG